MDPQTPPPPTGPAAAPASLADRYAALLLALADRPPATMAELAATLGWPEYRTVTVLRDLVVRDRVRVHSRRERGRKIVLYDLNPATGGSRP